MIHFLGLGERAVTPLNILSTQPVLWLHAARGVTLNGANVSTWADQSGSGNNATQAAPANQPLFVASAVNGKPAVRGDVATKFLGTPAIDLSTGPDATLFMVSKVNGSLAATTVPFEQGGVIGTDPEFAFNHFGSQLTAIVKRSGSARSVLGVSNAGSNVYHTYIQRCTQANPAATEVQMWFKGVQQVLGAGVNSVGNLGNFDVTIFGRGTSFTYLGDICELILSPVSVPDAEIDRMISYLRAGWTGATVIL